MRNKKHMHLAQFLMHSPTSHSLAMWRHPCTDPRYDWARPELYQHIAQSCERGKLDMVFFADVSFISDTYTGSLDPAIRYATQTPNHDPTPLLSWIGAGTRKIGLGGTFSISHQHPFYVARLWATIDHLTPWPRCLERRDVDQSQRIRQLRRRVAGARSALRARRRVHGGLPQAVEQLEADAVVMDRERGVFADPAKVHRIEHAGRFFTSRGPLNVTRSPQNGPAIIQAGASAKGRAFAAQYAEAIFALHPFAEGAAEYYADVKGQMEDVGRNPDHCKILFGIQPIVGRTEQEAREKQEFHNSLVPVEAGLTILSGHLDYDFSRVNLDLDFGHF